MKLLALLLSLFAPLAFATDLTLNWLAPTTYVDKTSIPAGTAITYTVYGGPCGGTLTSLTAGITTLTNVRPNVNPGNWGYAVSATIAGVESAQTVPVCATVSPAPAPPGGLTVTPVTTSTIAYGLAPAHDRLAFLIVGSVPLGTACLTDQSANAYRVVPVATVSFDAPYKPTTVPTVFALCSA